MVVQANPVCRVVWSRPLKHSVLTKTRKNKNEVQIRVLVWVQVFFLTEATKVTVFFLSNRENLSFCFFQSRMSYVSVNHKQKRNSTKKVLKRQEKSPAPTWYHLCLTSVTYTFMEPIRPVFRDRTGDSTKYNDKRKYKLVIVRHQR